MIDPALKPQFATSMTWIRYVIDAVIADGDKAMAETMCQELQGQTVKLARHFDLLLRTGNVRKIENPNKS